MDVSIIICTQNRSSAILRSLDSVYTAITQVENINCELMIVDNLSTDNTNQVVTEWINNHPNINAKITVEDKKGLSHARNCGLLNTSGDLIIFTDDDCRMSTDYIHQAFSLYRKDVTPTFRGGRVTLGDPRDFPVSIRTSEEFKEFKISDNDARYDHFAALLMGCNMAFPRSIVNHIGLFDTRFGAGTNIFGAEDTDYYFRAYMAGYPVQYDPSLLIVHYHGRRDEQAVYKIKKNYMIGTGALYTKYLLKHFNLCRPLVWDFKQLLKEIVTFRNLYIPEAGISYKHMFWYMTIGMLRYLRKTMPERQNYKTYAPPTPSYKKK